MHITVAEGLGIIFAFSVLVEIVPIKINPWGMILKAIGKMMNQDMVQKIESLQNRLETHIDEEERKDVVESRRRLLRFNDEILMNIPHTKEHFRDCMRDIDTYESYCRNHPEFKNNEAVATIQNIQRIYEDRLKKNDFL